MQVTDRTKQASAQEPVRSRGNRGITPSKTARPAPPGGKKARQASNIPYRRLFETAPDGMLLISAGTGRVTQVNRALTELSGYRAAEIRGKKLWEIPPLRATDAGLVVFREIRKQKRIFYDDLPFETKERKRLTVELVCSMHDIGGTKLIQCTIRDVTRHKQVRDELWNAEARFQAVFRHAGIGIALMDMEGRFVDGNARLCQILGYDAKELGSLTCTSITHRDGRAAQAELFRELREGKRDSYHLAQRCIRKDGASFWALITVSAIHGAGREPRFMILTMEDITERKRAEESVINSRDFFRSLIYELPNPIRITDTDAKCDYVNKAWLEFTGRRLDQEIGEGWTGGVHPEDLQRVRETCAVSFRNRSPYVTEFRLAHRSGEYRWLVEFGRPFNDIDGSFAGYISSCYDVHERKIFEDRLHSISFTDDLTGLLNRRGFFTFAQQQLKQANRSRKGFLFLYADLDGLKTINDTLGHQEGDLALVEASHILREVFRDSDIIARLGGDEFAVLMPENTGAGDEAAIVKRLHESIAEHNAQQGRRFSLSLSAGIKQYDPSNPCTLDELISRADRLMYREKRSKQSR